MEWPLACRIDALCAHDLYRFDPFARAILSDR
jgi:hypothetical protein